MSCVNTYASWNLAPVSVSKGFNHSSETYEYAEQVDMLSESGRRLLDYEAQFFDQKNSVSYLKEYTNEVHFFIRLLSEINQEMSGSVNRHYIPVLLNQNENYLANVQSRLGEQWVMLYRKIRGDLVQFDVQIRRLNEEDIYQKSKIIQLLREKLAHLGLMESIREYVEGATELDSDKSISVLRDQIMSKISSYQHKGAVRPVFPWLSMEGIREFILNLVSGARQRSLFLISEAWRWILSGREYIATGISRVKDLSEPEVMPKTEGIPTFKAYEIGRIIEIHDEYDGARQQLLAIEKRINTMAVPLGDIHYTQLYNELNGVRQRFRQDAFQEGDAIRTLREFYRNHLDSEISRVLGKSKMKTAKEAYVILNEVAALSHTFRILSFLGHHPQEFRDRMKKAFDFDRLMHDYLTVRQKLRENNVDETALVQAFQDFSRAFEISADRESLMRQSMQVRVWRSA